MNTFVKTCLTAAAVILLVAATDAQALIIETGVRAPLLTEPETPRNSATQRGCMSLSQAVESVRSRGNVKQIISAETDVRNGREVHVIRVLTNNGRVTTHRIPGCRRD